MIGEIGQFSRVVALMIALLQGILPLWGAARNVPAWMALAQPAAQAQFLFVMIAFLTLVAAFVGSDFTLLLVAQHSNTALPTPYRVAAVWGNHEGSMLLWVLMLGLWSVAVSIFSRRLPPPFVARVLGIMGLISAGFLAFLLFTSNPFQRLLPAAAEGRDLNPLLQDPGMVFHPPMLYMGYVGFSVAFAFAIAALLSGRLDAAWARWSRPWTTLAWMFLTLGIALGSNWAYYELGWGGWWFWDPVENASFLPWLAGTALIHSLAVTEKRGVFRSWTVLLAIIAFSLSLLGTFLVRSGVLTSVHAFAVDPKRGVFMLGFLAVVIGSSLLLFAWRAPKVGLGAGFQAVSRESMLLANNVLLVVAAAAVLLGTLYPLVIDALGMGKLSVGPPYFDTVFVPLMAPALFLMGVGPIARWRQASVPDLAYRLRWAFGVSAVSAVVAFLLLGRWTPMIGLGLALAAWITSTAVLALLARLQENRSASWRRRFAAQPGSFYGMLLAHFGVAVFIVGVTIVSGFESENDVRMEIGDTATVAGYQVRLDKIEDVQGPNYQASRATLTVLQDGRLVATVRPDRRVYNVSRSPMTEVAINRGLLRDVYIALGDPVSATAWSVRLHHKPFVNWIWIGCVLMALGGLLAVMDRRYRKVRVHQSASLPAAGAADGRPGPAGTAGVATARAGGAGR